MDELNRQLHDELRRMNAVLHRGKKRRHGHDAPPADGAENAGWHEHGPDHRPDPHRGNHAASQYRVLSKLLESDGISQRDLTVLLGVRPQSTGELVDKLETAGLVQRRRSDIDRRVVNIFLTDSGRQKAQELHSEDSRDLDTVFAPLTEEEKLTLLALLQKLNEANSLSPDRG